LGSINLDKRPNGIFRARWSEDGERHYWNTGTSDRHEALKKAGEELARRKGFTRPPAAPPGSAPGQLPVGPPPVVSTQRRPIGEALARVLATPPASAASPPSGPAPASGAGAVLEGELVRGREQLGDAQDVAKVRHVHRVVGKSASHLVEGLLKRAVKFAGREPEDMDDDERALIEEGCTELAAEYLGQYKLTPGGKVMAGALCAGVGMYMGGRPIPKPQPAPLKLVPPGDPPKDPPAGSGNGSGGG